jgi:hypothetical protein
MHDTYRTRFPSQAQHKGNPVLIQRVLDHANSVHPVRSRARCTRTRYMGVVVVNK